jgi:hypothetical protein
MEACKECEYSIWRNKTIKASYGSVQRMRLVHVLVTVLIYHEAPNIKSSIHMNKQCCGS